MRLREVKGPKNADILKNSEFRRWFGNSKVVDESGQPLLLFHGTAYDFDVFKSNVIWGTVDPEFASAYSEGRSLWDKLADNYSELMGSNVMPIFMKVERPFNADLVGQRHSSAIDTFVYSMIDQAKENGTATSTHEKYADKLIHILEKGARREESGPVYATHQFWLQPDWSFGKQEADLLTRFFFTLRFDGIHYSEKHMDYGKADVETWGTFYPSHVKSAIGNIGTYSDAPSISESSK